MIELFDATHQRLVQRFEGSPFAFRNVDAGTFTLVASTDGQVGTLHGVSVRSGERRMALTVDVAPRPK
jgi:hypothetical protein